MTLIILAAAAAVAGAPGAETFGWREGAVYTVAARPGRVTDIVLQPGERLGAVNPVAAGDTVRWIVGDSESGAGEARQAHVLVKPVEAGLATNLVIATDRRTYHLELRASAGSYMAVVSWRYPEGELAALKGRAPLPAPPPAAAAPGPAPDIPRLNFGYRIEGEAPFRPLRVYDDGRRTVIEFPASVRRGEMPPLVLPGAKGEPARLVNYRVDGLRMIVDRLFDAAELRLGADRRQATVRIVREAEAVVQ